MALWYILFSRTEDIPVDAVVQALNRVPGFQSSVGDDFSVLVRYGGDQLEVHANSKDYVLDESREIARIFDKSGRYTATLESCNRRFELYYDNELSENASINILIRTQEVLDDLVAGVTFDPDNGEFI
jgi:hypothetical protein